MTLELSRFLTQKGALIDVRSPIEFNHAHIPGSHNIPLFSDEERALVGTTYKREGAQKAIKLGLFFTGPKLLSFVEEAEKLSSGSPLRVYCFRGGMRSQSMAWLLKFTGLDILTLKGGYKAFRKEALQLEKLIENKAFSWNLISGLTGCGKTALLHEKGRQGEPVLDLEALANHRGSAFGSLGLGKQPSQEMFENRLFMELERIPSRSTVWIEHESRLIGRCVVPKPLIEAMKNATIFKLEKPLEERLLQILQDYGHCNSQELILATKQLQKRLGNEKTTKIVNSIEKGEATEAIKSLLAYYDSSYKF